MSANMIMTIKEMKLEIWLKCVEAREIYTLKSTDDNAATFSTDLR